MIRWFARNDIAANLLLIAILLWGGYSAMEKVPIEVQPAIRFNQVDVNVIYRGGTPEDVESAVLIPIENALEGMSGVKQVFSFARIGSGAVHVIAHDHVKPQDLLEEVKSRLSRVTSFPPETEPPRVNIPDSSLWFDVVKVAVSGQMDAADLLRAARKVRDDLVALPEISQAVVLGNSPLEIAIEADPARLRDFGLSLADLVTAVQRSSLDLPAGQIQTDEGSLTIRTKGQAYEREQFESILLRTRQGAEVQLGEVAKVGDGFEENRKIIRMNGVPCLLVEVLRLNQENALEIADAVKGYVASAPSRFPVGIQLHLWDDSSEELRGRLGTLLGSLLQGSLLVLIVLGLFLRPAIAFWVTLGIPVAFAGGFIAMPWMGVTSNVMSLFGFIIVVGIIVDDAIVTADHVYDKLKSGVPPLTAAIDGTHEVAVPVTFGALTTIVAFVPLMYFDGFYGSFTRQIPPVVTAVLLFSLIESKLCLPAHLKHVRMDRPMNGRFSRFQSWVSGRLDAFVQRCYDPALRLTTRHRYTTLAAFAAVSLAAFGYLSSGALGFVNMPSIDRNRINAQIQMPRDTPIQATEARVREVARAVAQLRKEFTDPATGKSLIGEMLTSSGGPAGRPGVDPRVGFVTIAVTDPGQRSTPGPKNSQIAARWKELVGELRGVQSFWISGDRGGGFGSDQELQSLTIELRGEATEAKEQAIEEIERLLKLYDGIEEVWDNAGGNRDELLVKVRPEGEALGITQRELAKQVRAAFYGEQAQKVLRGRDEIRVMVRLPRKLRSSLATFDHLTIRTPAGAEVPFHTVASATYSKAKSDISRVDGAQAVSIHAKPTDETVDVVAIARNLAPRLDAFLGNQPELSWRYTGYIAEHEETRSKAIWGGALLLFGLYALLAIPFRSLYQPFFVMLAIPFGAIGAMIGHLVMDITPSYLSVFGLLALAGVVVNDSLVMVDFINRKIRAGEDPFESVVESGTRRFRPIFLTSATTFAGLVPLLFDRSLQGQFLIPMAASLAFGLLFATVITLFLVPAAYLAAEDVKSAFLRLWRGQPSTA